MNRLIFDIGISSKLLVIIIVYIYILKYDIIKYKTYLNKFVACICFELN